MSTIWKKWKFWYDQIVGKYLRFEKSENFMWIGQNHRKIATIWKMWIERRCRKILEKYLRFEKRESFYVDWTKV